MLLKNSCYSSALAVIVIFFTIFSRAIDGLSTILCLFSPPKRAVFAPNLSLNYYDIVETNLVLVVLP